MSAITAYTFVICPVGTTIELYQTDRPKIGETFDIIHIDTKKVVQTAKVTKVEEYRKAPPYYRILAEIIG